MAVADDRHFLQEGLSPEMLPTRPWFLSIVLSCVALTSTFASQPDYFSTLRLPAQKFKTTLLKSRSIVMRDGVKLSADVYMPEGATGRLPVVLMQTPYDKNFFRSGPANWQELIAQGVVEVPPSYESPLMIRIPYLLSGEGYIVVVMDMRGRGESEGRFFPYDKLEGRDGYDAIDWISRQSWSNRKVGTLGCSYLGEVQYMTAAQHHPAHTTAIFESGAASMGGGGSYNFGFGRYGALELAAAAGWLHDQGSSFSYGPPPGIDRQQWFSSSAAGRFATQMTGNVSAGPDLEKALATLPMSKVMAALGPSDTEWDNWARYTINPEIPIGCDRALSGTLILSTFRRSISTVGMT